MPPAADVAVVVATRNRPDQARSALQALAAETSGVDLVVVDSASDSDETRAVARAVGVRCVRADRPGLSIARNLGVAATDAAVIAFTDDDCRPRPGWIAALTAPFDDASVGFVTGEVIGLGEGTAADVAGLGPVRWRWPDDPVRMGSGANMAVRRVVVDEVGGFDPSIGAGARVPSAEDHDLFLKALRAGWEGAHAPGAVVDHDDRRSRWETVRLCYRYGVGSGVVCARATTFDPAVGRQMLRTRLWTDGVRGVAEDLRRGWEGPALRRAAMALGVLRGRLHGSGWPPSGAPQPRSR